MRAFILGFIAAFVVVSIGGYLFLASGGLPMAMKSPPLPFEERVAKLALSVAVKNEAGKTSPIPVDDHNLSEGSKLYAQHCAVCHGSPHIDQSVISKGIFPEPPYFFPPEEGVGNAPEGGIHWVVKNGIRMTAMPSFEGNLTDQQIWQVSLFIKNVSKLSEPVNKAFVEASKAYKN